MEYNGMNNIENVSREVVVVEYVQGVRPVPSYMQKLVEEYVARQQLVDGCTDYPQELDDEMNVLYDAMVILA
jgi:hypothetical protein